VPISLKKTVAPTNGRDGFLMLHYRQIMKNMRL